MWPGGGWWREHRANPERGVGVNRKPRGAASLGAGRGREPCRGVGGGLPPRGWAGAVRRAPPKDPFPLLLPSSSLWGPGGPGGRPTALLTLRKERAFLETKAVPWEQESRAGTYLWAPSRHPQPPVVTHLRRRQGARAQARPQRSRPCGPGRSISPPSWHFCPALACPRSS